MKESKRIEIEKKLRELFRQAKSHPQQRTVTPAIKDSQVRVIRRRKGNPDLRIA